MAGKGLSVDSVRRAERGDAVSAETAYAICAVLVLDLSNILLNAANHPSGSAQKTTDAEAIPNYRAEVFEYFVSIRNVTIGYGAFIALARWQFVSKSLCNKGRHWYINLAVVVMMTQSDRWNMLYKIIEACEAHDRAFQLFALCVPKNIKRLANLVRIEFVKLRHVANAFIEVLEKGNTVNPDHIGFNPDVVRKNVETMLYLCGVTPHEIVDLRQILNFTTYRNQSYCCPMPVDDLMNNAVDVVTIDYMHLGKRNDLFYSILDTAYYDKRVEGSIDRASRDGCDDDLAKRIKCIAFCTLFLNWPDVVGKMNDYSGTSDGHVKAKNYVMDYVRNYISKAAEYLLGRKMINEYTRDHWNEIGSQPDLEVEVIAGGMKDIQKSLGNVDMLSVKWITPEGLIRTDPL